MEYSWPWIKQMSDNIKQIQPRIDEVQEENLNVKLLQDESIRTLCVQRMNKVVDESYTGTSEKIYTYIITYVKRIAHEVLGTKKKKVIGGPKKFNMKYKRWLNSNREEDRRICVEKKRNLNKTTKSAKNEAWERVCANINSKFGI
jgi:hypothetical protein